jgi:hypothetical protein
MLATGFSNVSNETLAAKPAVSGSGVGGIAPDAPTEGSGGESVGGERAVRAKYEDVGARPVGEMAGDKDCGVPGRDSCCWCFKADRRGRPDSREGRGICVEISDICGAVSGKVDTKEGRPWRERSRWRP